MSIYKDYYEIVCSRDENDDCKDMCRSMVHLLPRVRDSREPLARMEYESHYTRLELALSERMKGREDVIYGGNLREIVNLWEYCLRSERKDILGEKAYNDPFPTTPPNIEFQMGTLGYIEEAAGSMPLADELGEGGLMMAKNLAQKLKLFNVVSKNRSRSNATIGTHRTPPEDTPLPETPPEEPPTTRPRSHSFFGGTRPTHFTRPRSKTIIGTARPTPFSRPRSNAMIGTTRPTPFSRPRSNAMIGTSRPSFGRSRSGALIGEHRREPNYTKAIEKFNRAMGGDIFAVQADLIKIQSALGDAYENLRKGIIDNITEEALDAGLESGLTFHDIVALADAAQQAHADPNHAPTPFLTSSNWASGAGIVCTLFSIGVLVYKIRKDGFLNSKMAVTQTFLDTIKFSAQAYVAIDAIHQGFNSGSSLVNVSVTIGEGALNFAELAVCVNAGIGVITGGIQVAVEGRNLWKLHSIKDRYRHELKYNPLLRELLCPEKGSTIFHRSKIRTAVTELRVFDKILQKIRHRQYYAGIAAVGGIASATGGAVGIVSTLIATGVIVGAANIWNPIGWACVGVAAASGLGMVGWKIGRRKYKERKLKRMRKTLERSGGLVPVWLSTTGDYYRWRMAMIIYLSVMESEILNANVRDVGLAFARILFGGKNEEACYMEASKQGVQGIMCFIKG